MAKGIYGMMATMVAVGTMVASPELVHADAVTSVTDSLAGFNQRIGVNDWPAFVQTDPKMSPAACTAVIATAKKAGVKPEDKLIGYFEKHPKAKPIKGERKVEITFADADWICTQYGVEFKLQAVIGPIRKAAEVAADLKTAPTAESSKGYNSGAGETMATQGRECMKTIDQAIKDGLSGDTKFKVKKQGETTLEGSKKFCQTLIDHGTTMEGFIKEEQKAKRAERAKKYTDAGIGGAKLELMIEYDDVAWRVKGCDKVDDPATLAKATVLFQWLENSDGTHTIRRYQFSGNKVSKKSDKKYITEALAYKGCK